MDQLHREVRLALKVALLENLDQTGMIQPTGQSKLALKAQSVVQGRAHGRAQHLEGDLLALASGSIDPAHATLAERLEDLVAVDDGRMLGDYQPWNKGATAVSNTMLCWPLRSVQVSSTRIMAAASGPEPMGVTLAEA